MFRKILYFISVVLSFVTMEKCRNNLFYFIKLLTQLEGVYPGNTMNASKHCDMFYHNIEKF